MGAASKAINVCLRIWELICAAVVTGVVGEYVNYTTDAHAHTNSKIIYTLALGGISILFSLILLPPFKHAFWAFPFDLALFIMWMVSFGLLLGVSSHKIFNYVDRLTRSSSSLDRPAVTPTGTGAHGAITGVDGIGLSLSPVLVQLLSVLQGAQSGELPWHLVSWAASLGSLARFW
jgi:Membrane-associating domain